MISYGKLVVICSVLIVFNLMVVVNHWITNSQNDVTKVQPCHRKDCCFLSESAKEPEKTVATYRCLPTSGLDSRPNTTTTVATKREKENSQGTVVIFSVLTLVH